MPCEGDTAEGMGRKLQRNNQGRSIERKSALKGRLKNEKKQY